MEKTLYSIGLRTFDGYVISVRHSGNVLVHTVLDRHRDELTLSERMRVDRI
jgi:hypothetical protein